MPDKGVRTTGAEFTGGYELGNMDAGIWTLVLMTEQQAALLTTEPSLRV